MAVSQVYHMNMNYDSWYADLDISLCVSSLKAHCPQPSPRGVRIVASQVRVPCSLSFARKSTKLLPFPQHFILMIRSEKGTRTELLVSNPDYCLRPTYLFSSFWEHWLLTAHCCVPHRTCPQHTCSIQGKKIIVNYFPQQSVMNSKVQGLAFTRFRSF